MVAVGCSALCVQFDLRRGWGAARSEGDVGGLWEEGLDSTVEFCYDMGGGGKMSVLGRPQGDWDDFLEDARKPKKRWRLSRILLVAAAVAVAATVMVYYYYQGG